MGPRNPPSCWAARHSAARLRTRVWCETHQTWRNRAVNAAMVKFKYDLAATSMGLGTRRRDDVHKRRRVHGRDERAASVRLVVPVRTSRASAGCGCDRVAAVPPHSCRDPKSRARRAPGDSAIRGLCGNQRHLVDTHRPPCALSSVIAGRVRIRARSSAIRPRYSSLSFP